jgi:hypothetical protein
MKQLVFLFPLLFILTIYSSAQIYQPPVYQTPSTYQPFGNNNNNPKDQSTQQYSQERGQEDFAIYQDYTPGYYYDTSGSKVAGFLQMIYSKDDLFPTRKGSCRLNFKKDMDTETVFLNVLNTNSFVIGSDSFAIVKNFNPNITYHDKDFARVLEVGKISLYLFPTMVKKKLQAENFLYEKTKGEFVNLLEKNGVVYSLTKSNFSDVMQKLLNDYPELENYIESKKMQYTPKDTRTIVRIYNKHFTSITSIKTD